MHVCYASPGFAMKFGMGHAGTSAAGADRRLTATGASPFRRRSAQHNPLAVPIFHDDVEVHQVRLGGEVG